MEKILFQLVFFLSLTRLRTTFSEIKLNWALCDRNTQEESWESMQDNQRLVRLLWRHLMWWNPLLSPLPASQSLFPPLISCVWHFLPSHHIILLFVIYTLNCRIKHTHTLSLSTRGLLARSALTKGQQWLWLCPWQWLSGQPACHTLHHDHKTVLFVTNSSNNVILTDWPPLIKCFVCSVQTKVVPFSKSHKG